MADPDTDVFYAEMIDDGLGEGLRLYTQEDAVYEMRGDGVMETRIYGEDGEWKVKACRWVGGAEERERYAYEIFRDTIYDLADTYDEEITVPALEFMDGDHRRDIEFTEEPVTVRYNEEENVNIAVDLPDERKDWWKAAARSFGSYTVRPAAVTGSVTSGLVGISGALAAAGDPAVTLAGAGVLAALSGGAAALFGGGVGAANWGWKEARPMRNGQGKAWKTSKWKDRFKEKRERQKIEEGRDGSLLQKGTFLDRLNERNRLAATVDEMDDYKLAERFQELNESGVQAVFDVAMAFQFTQFEDRAGVTLEATTSSYDAAAQLAADITGVDTVPAERPTIFGDAEAFAGLLDATPEPARERMVAEALKAAEDPVSDYLDEHHEELVERVGREEALYGTDTETGGAVDG